LPLLDVFTEKENYQGRKKKKSKVVHMDHKLSTPPKSLNPHILIWNSLLFPTSHSSHLNCSHLQLSQ
jgi:competence transcription factor ComK